MILLPQSVIHDCLAVFRRALPKPFVARAATPIQITGDRDGVRLCLAQTDVCIEYHHPSPSERVTLTIPISALTDSEGRGVGTVQFHSLKNGRIDVRWDQAGVPYHRECASPDSAKMTFPAWPGRDVANDPSLLEALGEAMCIADGSSGRMSFRSVQLRGKQGDVVATDGRQLLIQGGFQFPWKDGVLLSRTPIFAARELPKGQVIRVAQTKTHVFFRIGGWTIALPTDSEARFPKVDDVIPKADPAATRWHIDDDEAAALAPLLDKLPTVKEAFAPVTLDLARNVAIRARGEDEKRCTEVVLPRSKFDGKALRLATNRHFLRRALHLGFRSIQIGGSDKPFLCRDGNRLYVWVPLDSRDALAPQAHAIRVMLPTVAGRNGGAPVHVADQWPKSTAPIPVQRPVPARTGAPPKPTRVFEGLVNCIRGLWGVVRKHRQEKEAK